MAECIAEKEDSNTQHISHTSPFRSCVGLPKSGAYNQRTMIVSLEDVNVLWRGSWVSTKFSAANDTDQHSPASGQHHQICGHVANFRQLQAKRLKDCQVLNLS